MQLLQRNGCRSRIEYNNTYFTLDYSHESNYSGSMPAPGVVVLDSSKCPTLSASMHLHTRHNRNAPLTVQCYPAALSSSYHASETVAYLVHHSIWSISIPIQ